jgi:hypothetical protein
VSQAPPPPPASRLSAEAFTAAEAQRLLSEWQAAKVRNAAAVL